MLKPALFAAALAFAVTPAIAKDARNEASAKEAARITAVIAKIGCKPGDEGIEKERDDLFEIDDAQCNIGQYDIKLNSKFQVTSLTLD